MVRLVIKEPERVSLHLSEKEYPREIKLELMGYYDKAMLVLDSGSKEYTHGFYVLHSYGYINFENPTRNVSIQVAAELAQYWISGGKPLSLKIQSKPLSRKEIYEIDTKLTPDDVKIHWSIDAHGFLEENYTREYNVGLIPIFIGTERLHNISRADFIKNVTERADLLRREFMEVLVEPIDLSYVKDAKIRSALTLLLEKQKLLLGAMNKLKEAKTATDFRGVIDEVRRVVEGLEGLKDPCEGIYQRLYIESSDVEAINEASKEMSEAVVHGLNTTYKYASRFGIHTKTLSKKLYTPIPTRIEAEFGVQQAIIELNYLIKLLNAYALRT
jgi:hypothetical protein